MSSLIHQEVVFEDEICKHLQGNGWLFDGPLPFVKSHAYDAGYDKRMALYPADAITWVKATQPETWTKFAADHGTNADAEREFAAILAKELDRDRKTIKKDDPQLWGSLHVLRKGFKHIASTFKMAQFAPVNGLNPKLWSEFNGNILRVVRQVHYSLHNGNNIDLVLFVNGIPVATIELKVETTQSIEAAVKQYRQDRLPVDPPSNMPEPLLTFGSRVLVHFALSSDEVRMTTKLDGAKTRFLPFNRGIADGLGGASAGNPADHERGHATAYLWHEIFKREAFLDILGKFISVEVKESIHVKTGKKALSSSLLFPRYHQHDAVNELLKSTLKEGVGKTYLVQHSAGSGKSNTIGWVAHRLSSLFDAHNNKVFTSVIVITDRNVLDQQLQDTIKQFEATPGVVVRIDEDSTQLAKALDGEAKIIVTTLQKFPHVIKKTGSMKGRSFAVIVDEAHSSQSGKTAVQLREALNKEGFTAEASELEKEGDEDKEVTSEDLVARLMSARKRPTNISYYAFTATPKAKTLELFGRKGPDGLPVPFHVYSMRQAIEEKFILDVLKGYVTYDAAFKLEQQGKDQEMKSGKARKKLFQYVALHPTSVAQKVAMIIEHFRDHVMGLLNGQAKAMVVTDSRKAAVRYKKEFDKYMAKAGYHDFKALVAYSGTITDDEYGVVDAGEGDVNGGKPKIKDDLIKEKFNTDEYRVLLVANKFQTGFDQPLLCAMYVDKRLDDVMAVQTLSRLNRMFPGKESTFVLDFRNKAEDVLKAFMPFYRTAALSSLTDRNLPHHMREKLDAAGVYLWEEIEAFSKLYFSTRNDQAFQAHLKQAHERYVDLLKEEQELFRRDAGTFITAYDFLSQIVDYNDADLEKLHAFLKMLQPRLHGQEDDPISIEGAARLAGYKLKNKTEHALDLGAGEAKKLDPMAAGGGAAWDDPKLRLSTIIMKMNEIFAGKHSESETEGWATAVIGNAIEDAALAEQAKANSTAGQFANGNYRSVLSQAIIRALESHHSMSEQALQNPKVFEEIADLLLPEVYEKARGQNGSM
ncbi:type I restriction endonuclease subunit R [Variovorax sp. 770b2]|uniref:type I restriction endonuclease subunit R n=1 Tax=Variovorax sp. 770b2 TaxID=1566271 RepID=UPI0008F1B042|nr:DEAD/DEAH box helicase family protein [Variovorax sp. 770b2]SFQ34170.1 type I restriction enzyme, R subunit [Variovorax sp. 770b2]